MASQPTKAELDAKEEVLRARTSVEENLDHLIKMAHANLDTPATKASVLSAVDILVEKSHLERDARRDAVVKQYEELAQKKGKGGHA